MKGREAVETAAASVRARWGHLHAGEVQRDDAQAWIAAETGSPSRKRKLAQCLAGALRIGVSRGVIEGNPAEGLRVPKEVPREPVHLDVETVRAVADATGMPRRPGIYAGMVWLLVTTGVRVGEAVAMDVGDVQERTVKGRPVWRARIRRSKSGVARDVPVPTSVVLLLDLARPADAPLFVSPHGGRLRLGNWRRRVWAPAVEAAGVSGLVPHELRHTAASWAIADGADVKAVQRMLGHKSAKMTLDLYGHLWDEGLDRVADGMDSRMAW